MMLRKVLKSLKWLSLGLAGLIVLLLLPVGYVETFCRDKPGPTSHHAIINQKEFLRAEANSFLTYPEWHIVYAYEGLAKVLETGDEYNFDYIRSVTSFWSSFCDLNKKANRHGGGDFTTRGTIHIIGVSFTAEMAMKALYEETVGRIFALVRGKEKTPQDIFSAEMAADYAKFLRQVPWYKYDFEGAVKKLWSLPVTSGLRSWERRLALGGEWKAKARYARVIASMVEASGQAVLRIRSVVTGLDKVSLSAIKGVDVIEVTPDYVMIETPRYRKFTRIIQQIVARGGRLVEIAGNDDIMLSAVGTPKITPLKFASGDVISVVKRDGYRGQRVLVSLKTEILIALFEELDRAGLVVEHIYDY